MQAGGGSERWGVRACRRTDFRPPSPFLPPPSSPRPSLALTLLMNVPHVPHRIDIGSIILTFSAFRSARFARGSLDGSKSGG